MLVHIYVSIFLSVLDNPKSAIFATKFSSNNMLVVLISLWIIPRSDPV
uniref:Uncharacterized protein n=1 Tax=Solanum lycopersicum TaxID=4081 RepID=A0A3Q7F1N0_SOLLC